MGSPNLCYTPRLKEAEIEDDLSVLMAPGRLTDADLERRIARLAMSYRLYRTYYPHGLWAPGMAITREMRNLTELYLPIDDMRRVFDCFFTIALRFSPLRCASLIHNAANWFDVPSAMQPLFTTPDPASFLMRLLYDEKVRRCFIFANFMPARHGGGFGRYPVQSEFLRWWLGENRVRLASVVRALDVACGSGEGTYELARIIVESGFSADSVQVFGATLEPFELFGAAHCYFPHNPGKTAACRSYAEELVSLGVLERITFVLDDLTRPYSAVETEYDIILCNGLLGGPILHDPRKVREIVRKLAGQLKSGGILLAASRFHGGWKKEMDDGTLRKIFEVCGLRILPIAEGVAGEKCLKF